MLYSHPDDRRIPNFLKINQQKKSVTPIENKSNETKRHYHMVLIVFMDEQKKLNKMKKIPIEEKRR